MGHAYVLMCGEPFKADGGSITDCKAAQLCTLITAGHVCDLQIHSILNATFSGA